MAKGATSLMNHATINKEFGMQSHKKAIAIVYIMFTKKVFTISVNRSRHCQAFRHGYHRSVPSTPVWGAGNLTSCQVYSSPKLLLSQLMFAFSSFDRRHGKIGVLDLDATPTVCVCLLYTSDAADE